MTTLNEAVAACKAAGFNITDAEVDILTRRLRPEGALRDNGVGPDPLAGTETDPVAAVEHLFSERVGLASRHFLDYPDVAEVSGSKPEPEPEPEPPTASPPGKPGQKGTP